jgi:hypothetical protein
MFTKGHRLKLRALVHHGSIWKTWPPWALVLPASDESSVPDANLPISYSMVSRVNANLPIASASASGTRYPKLKKDRISPTNL